MSINKTYAIPQELLDQIEKDSIEFHNWFTNTLDALEATPEQKAFIKQHDLYVSTAYIGMLRVYKNNNTIWQTSAFDPIFDCMNQQHLKFGESRSLINYNSLRTQFQHFITTLMGLDEETQNKVFSQNVPLF